MSEPEMASYEQTRQHEASTLAVFADQLIKARDAWWDEEAWTKILDAHIAFWSDVKKTCSAEGGPFPQDLKNDLTDLAGQVVGLCEGLKTQRDEEACAAVIDIDVAVAEGLLGLSKAAAKGRAATAAG